MTTTTMCCVFLIVYAILGINANRRLSKLETRLDFLEEQIMALHKISRNQAEINQLFHEGICTQSDINKSFHNLSCNQAEINQQVHDTLFKTKDVD